MSEIPLSIRIYNKLYEDWENEKLISGLHKSSYKLPEDVSIEELAVEVQNFLPRADRKLTLPLSAILEVNK